MKDQFSSVSANEEKMKQHCATVSSTTNSFLREVNQTTEQQTQQLDLVKAQNARTVEEVRDDLRELRKKVGSLLLCSMHEAYLIGAPGREDRR